MSVVLASYRVSALVVDAGAVAFSRASFRALLFMALPGLVVMRVGAEWISRKEGWNEVKDTPTWLDLGFLVADLGAIVFIVSVILAGLGARRLRRTGGEWSTLGRLATALTIVLLVGYLVAVWAMTAKPT